MFAIIKTGGKQYKVAANDIIKIEKLLGTTGDSIEFSDVLMMGEGNTTKVGAPLVANAKVYGTILDQIRDDKVIIFKKNRRHNYRRKNGHRQYLTVVRITDILADGATRKAAPAPAKAEAKPVEKKAESVKKVEAPKKPEPVKQTAAPKKAEAPKKAAPAKKPEPAKKAEAVKKTTTTSAKGAKPAAAKKAAPTPKKTTKN